ncbi:MAG: putative hydro-lyase [Planctomycetes bacterium]|nr:putative hydro-lyase [Planctomycetota bacterium]
MTVDRKALLTAEQVRLACRAGVLREQTSGLAAGFAQANLVILPRDLADDFLLFCQRNPKPCPLLDVTAPGSWVPPIAAPTGDLRTDVPRYRVWRDGQLAEERDNICELWRDDFVGFVIGCSFTFEAALSRANVPVRHIEQGVNVPMYRTNIPCRPAGVFHGPLVVSMRPLKPADAIRAVQITSRYPAVHGAPVHLGLPEQLGIKDISRPDFGDAVSVASDELPVFWACGVTPQAVAMAARPPLMITHSPGCMFLTDLRDEELAVG